MTAAPPLRVALVGSPNSGKTTLFNALTGLRQKVGNYPGVTVDYVQGQVRGSEAAVTLIDLPGTYNLQPISLDERVTVGVLQGTVGEDDSPDGVIVVIDATQLRRSLPLLAEVLAVGRPTLLVLTMIDELKARHGSLDVHCLQSRLGIDVVGVVGNKGVGIGDVVAKVGAPATWKSPSQPPPTEVVAQFMWTDQVLADIFHIDEERGGSDRLDRILLHPVAGPAVFIASMFVFFQLIFTVAAPLQDLFEGGVLGVGQFLATVLPDGLFKSLLVDGLVAGVGSVVVFVPQIALLLMLVALMDSSGYMARAAFIVDRAMGWAGLEGRCFVSLLSSYACAVPGIMAARTVPDPRSRLATILVAPLMTCSARLPVYALLISAFVPNRIVLGVLNLQALTFFGLYTLGSLSALLVAAVLKKGLLRGATYPFYMELPPYRAPSLKVVGHQVWRGVKAFLRKAGTIIVVVSIVLWVLLTFPQTQPPPELTETPGAARAYNMERSYAAQLGKAIEPAIEPLGFDWRIGVGLVASFAAREVLVATMGQILAFEGDEEDLEGLAVRFQTAKAPDGSPAYGLATALSLLVFFVFALQCVSTLAVMRRETGGFKWPAVAFAYTLVLAYTASLVTYQTAVWMGG